MPEGQKKGKNGKKKGNQTHGGGKRYGKEGLGAHSQNATCKESQPAHPDLIYHRARRGEKQGEKKDSTGPVGLESAADDRKSSGANVSKKRGGGGRVEATLEKGQKTDLWFGRWLSIRTEKKGGQEGGGKGKPC